jgi:primary-amine oxidase
VLWYSLGVHHIVRPEDWPVAPVAYAGFSLKPAGFFDGNPALDVPAPTHHGDGGCHA